MTAIDYAVEGSAEVESARELTELFRGRAGAAVRLIGSGMRQHRLPAPPQPVLLVRCALRALRRLDRDDLTCSVEPGLPLADLDAALAAEGLVATGLGDTGTVGGALAAGEPFAAAPGAPSPRNVLLGMEGVLTDGTPFKSGARVVKSVAGYDLHKLFVGSRGRLFAAVVLHLRLRRRPAMTEHFVCADLDQDAALARWNALRRASEPPSGVWLARGANGTCTVHGTIAGSAATVRDCLRRHELRAGEARPRDVSHADGSEVVAGLVRPSRTGHLLEALPGAPVLVAGTGSFVARLAPADSDALLASCSTLPARAWIRSGAPARRGIATAHDPAAARLERELMQALDPQRMLT